MKLVIDTDPGVDDAMAITFAALHPDIELLGLTTVFGNVTAAQGTRNALYLAERLGISVPVAEGANIPRALPPFKPSVHVHGPEGLGDLPAPEPTGKAIGESAAQFLSRIARENPGEIVLCPVGPMTNVAAAIDLDPDFIKNIKSIVFMGGTLDRHGNVSPFAEANTWHDPHALDVVLQSGADITMVGLDVTMSLILKAADFSQMAKLNPRHGGFLQDISHFYLEFYKTVGEAGCGFHDPMTIVAALHPEMFEAESTPLAVKLDGEEIGRTYRTSGRAPVRVCLNLDVERVKATFMDALATN
ncbi:nucleoside hydrolase [Devosia sp. Root685]|uniref:nucleoside hydrolase n=1 Tax=Devosia sp. Root685 TaxID=1736587 RepID=UPI0006F9FECA|nr:nucleoside hydrolase [Devosia sp. Root685]KRA95569.1 nucleoside hydrolase [Devosia sp. Root685]